MRVVLTLFCALLGIGCTYTPPPGERMSGEAFIAAVRGNTMDGFDRNGLPFQTYVTEDLVQRGVSRPPGRSEFRYAGEIRAAEHGFCSKSPQLRGGAERCFEVWRDGPTYRVMWDGSIWTTNTIIPGNPAGL